MAKSKTTAPKNPDTAPSEPAASSSEETISEGPSAASRSREDLVREAAYRRYESRGSAEGSPDQDWLDAEAEVARQQTGA